MKKSLLKILAFFVVLVASLPIFLVATNFKVYADGHEHDEITSEWDSDNSLPSSYGNYYLTKDVTISSTWYPSRGVKLCLNGHSITMTGEGSVICIHGEGNAGGDYPVSIYDCSDVEHKYRINEEGLAVVDDTLTENYETFKGGYITGGNSADDGGCINIYHEETELRTSTNLLSLNGVNLVGNKAAKRGGAIYSARSPRKNCIIYLNDVSIIGNVAGDTAGAIYHESNNKWLAINSANISKNTSTNAPAGIFEESEISVRGKVYIFDNKLTNGVQSDIVNTHANQDKFTVSGKLEEGSRIGYTHIKSQKIRNYYKEFDANDPTKNNDADPNTIFISNSIHSLVRAQDSKDDLQVLSVIAEEYTTHYDGNPHSIYFINDVESINGTIKYRTEKYGEYNLDTAPEFTDVGNYVIYYEITTPFFTEEGTQKITIDKPLPLTPTPKPGLQYTGDKQELVDIPENAGATFKFKLENGYWSEYIPKGVDIGEYSIQVKAIGDADHGDTEIVLIARIDGADKTALTNKIKEANDYRDSINADYKRIASELHKSILAAKAKELLSKITIEEISQAAEALNTEIDTAKAAVKSVDDVKAAIDAIGDVAYTDETKGKIDAARAAYDALHDSYKVHVTNYETLTNAESTYATFVSDDDKAKEVIAKIDSIGEVTLDSNDKITEVRHAYNALSDSQKAFVTNYETLTNAETTYASLRSDKDIAVPVENEISEIGEVTYTEESKTKIDAARASFDALTDTQKSLVSNYETLTSAEARYEELVNDSNLALEVEGLISAIGDVTIDSKDKIDAARAGYDALTDVQKALVSNYETLTVSEVQYTTILANKTKADAVVAKIAEIGEVQYNDECKEKIDAAKASYNVLTKDQQPFVTNIDVLNSADKKYSDVDYAHRAINSIGAVELTDEYKNKLNDIRTIYNALTDDEKALINNLNKLTNAEEDYQKLSDEKATTILLIVGIACGSLVLVLLVVTYILLFYVFNSWTLLKYKNKRVFRIGKKNGRVRLLCRNFRIIYRDEENVFKRKK